MYKYFKEYTDNEETLYGAQEYFKQTVIENSKMCHYKN